MVTVNVRNPNRKGGRSSLIIMVLLTQAIVILSLISDWLSSPGDENSFSALNQALDKLNMTRNNSLPSISLETSIPSTRIFPPFSLTLPLPDTMDNPHRRLKYDPPLPYPDAKLAIQPTLGHHRTDQDAVFSFARGFSLEDYLPFVSSLFESGYTGDLVLGVSTNLTTELNDYLDYHSQHYPLIVYEIPLSCIEVKIRKHCQTVGMFSDGLGRVLRDTRSHREVAQLRFEYYWAWSTLYSQSSRIWLLDARDVYIQGHPLETVDSDLKSTLYVYEESSVEPIWKQRSNRRWIKKAYGEDWFLKLRSKTIICSGSTLGGQPAIEMYTRAMIHQWDVTNCTVYGCDQGHHNFLISGNQLVGAPNITKIQIFKQGWGIVNTVGLLAGNKGPLRDLGLVDNTTNQVLNYDGSVSRIIHQYDRDIDFRKVLELRKRDLLAKWRGTRAKWKSHAQEAQ